MTTPPWRQALACVLPALLAGLGSSGAVQAQSIATGSRHGLALQPDGSLLAWGDNRQAQLGQGSTIYADTPREIALPVKARKVQASATGALLLDAQGDVWSWGTNRKGQLGDGTHADRAEPKLIFRGAIEIVNGGDTAPSFLIDSEGQPWWWGPLPTGGDAASPQRAAQLPARLVRLKHEANTTVALDEQGIVWSWGRGAACSDSTGVSAPVAMRGLPRITEFSQTVWTPLSYQPEHSRWNPPPASLVYAKDVDGNMWQWGTAMRGYPPDSGNPPMVVCPAARIAMDGSQFGVSIYAPYPALEQMGVRFLRAGYLGGSNITTGLAENGDLWQWRNPTSENPDGTAVTVNRIATGVADFSAFLPDPRLAAQAQGVLFITSEGRLYGTGLNTSLHLGPFDGAQGSSSSPQPLRLPGKAVSVHARTTGSFALLEDGRVYGWGAAAGAASPTSNINWRTFRQVPTLIALGAPVVKLAVSETTVFGVDAQGQLWSAYGRGNGEFASRTFKPALVSRSTGMPLVRDVATAVQGFAAMVGVDGSVWTIGSPVAVQQPVGQEGFSWFQSPGQVIGLPPSIVQVAATGYATSFALDASGTVWYWGGTPQFGVTATPFDWNGSPVRVPAALPLGQKAVSIHTGSDYAFCAVLQDGSAQCYGRDLNEHRGTRFRLHAPIKEMSISGDEVISSPLSGRSTGTIHFRLADGTVWAWGQGRQGQLGAGVYANAAEPVPVLNEAGTGDLDLDPATPNLATASLPPFRVKTHLAGNLRTLSFSADVFGAATGGGTGDGSTNVYAFATADLSTWVQLDEQGQWSLLRSPVPAAASTVPLADEGQSVPLPILSQFVGTGLAGARIFVGQGRDAQEMLQAQRFREVLELAPEDTDQVPAR